MVPVLQGCFLAASAFCGSKGQKKAGSILRIRKNGKVETVIDAERADGSIVVQRGQFTVKADGKIRSYYSEFRPEVADNRHGFLRKA